MRGMSRLWWALRARFKEKYWAVDTKLPKWQYHECDTRMLHANFSILVDYVEVELAHFESIMTDKPCIGKRCGIESLERQSKMVNDAASLWDGATEEDVLESYGKTAFKLSSHALVAIEVLFLYNWWKTRDSRKDITCDNVLELYDKYDEEDTEMLIRLIKVRGFLWT